MGHRGMLAADAGAFARNEGGGRNWLVGDYEAGDVVFHHPRECPCATREAEAS
jgi:phytanoyl-CoA hydroxylase